jgi:hypothetical protein
MYQMTLKELNKYALEAIKEYNLSDIHLTVICGIYHGSATTYSLQVFDPINKKHIRASQNNPSSALSEFICTLNLYYKKYNKEQIDITL